MVKDPTRITQKGKGGKQERVDFRFDQVKHTGGDLPNRRDNKFGKNQKVSKETVRSIFGID